jgi:nucleoside-diphosphate-sugar epimerase
MRILIVGATGFLGAAVRDELLLQHPDAAIVCVVRHPHELNETAWSAMDVANAAVPDLHALLARHEPDVIINCAGATTGSADTLDAANVRLVSKLIEAALKLPRVPRFVQLGSGAEYGITPQGIRVRESAELHPLSPYGMSKARATDLVISAASHFGLAAVVLRVFNPVGPGAPAGTLAGIAARKILGAMQSNDDTVELGSLDTYRDFVDVRDVARAVAAASLAADHSETVLNVGSGRATLARDMVATLAGVAGYTGHIIEVHPGSHRSPGVDWQCADLDLISARLGWAPVFDLDESMRAVWDECVAGRHVLPREAAATR